MLRALSIAVLIMTSCGTEFEEVHPSFESSQAEGLASECMLPAGVDPDVWNQNLIQAERILASVSIRLQDYCSTKVTVVQEDCVYRPKDKFCYWGLGGHGWITLNSDGGALVHELIHVYLASIDIVDDTNWLHVGWEEAGYLRAADEYYDVRIPLNQ
jgi:hypothetical protein